MKIEESKTYTITAKDLRVKYHTLDENLYILNKGLTNGLRPSELGNLIEALTQLKEKLNKWT